MPQLPPLPTMRDIIRLYRLRALKQLSQNFLMDLRLTDRVVRCAGSLRAGEVCEVGPGPGSITRSIINAEPSRVVLIEKDARFKPALDLLAEAAEPEVVTHIGDVMEFDMSSAFDEKHVTPWEGLTPNLHIIGNLPFSVSTPLIIRWLRDIHHRRSAWRYGRVKMTLTFQQEVAARICAPILTGERGRLSVMCQNWCKVDHKLVIPGRCFVPKPDVDVGVVTFIPRVKPIIPLDIDLVERVLRHIFSFRQKYSIKGAMRLFPIPQREELGAEMFSCADVNPHTRPFQLSIEEYGRLCAAYKMICEREPRLYKYDHRACRLDKEKRWDLFEDDEDEGGIVTA